MNGREAALLAVIALTVAAAAGYAVLLRRSVTREATTADIVLTAFTAYATVLAAAGWPWWLFFGGKVS